ncbi:MAG: ORC1-type DNA replication protein [Candidatus Nanohaloarchaeota archaeon QJJ-9]|nr:ORC1-type DNA replication protein [Candidatus Nanohaloarchaeota archaeon QJJ-9]
MGEDQKLQDKFSQYLENESIFNDKDVLSTNYKPNDILHREDQIEELASILAPSLKGNDPSNVFIYGTVGTGKTLVVDHVCKELKSVAENGEEPLDTVYINCKMKKVADTEYRLTAKLARELGADVPSTGLPTEEVYDRFFEALKDTEGVVIIILDEIDSLIKKIGDDFLYNLTRIDDDLGSTKVSVVGISNDLNFTDYMDARVKSSLSEEEIIFPPYNALELKEILRQRAEDGFVEGSLDDGVISKCSALAASEHGDARRAIDLLRVAGELSERDNKSKVTVDYVDTAQEKIEKDRVVETVQSQPKHSQLTLYTILQLSNNGGNVVTGDVYSKYKDIARKAGTDPLTQRRISDLIDELDMLGVIEAQVVSKGRHGRTRKISMDLGEHIESKLDDIITDKFYLN